MYVRHHRCHPAHVVILAQRTFLAGQHFTDVALHRGFPETLIGHVDGEFLGLHRDLHIFLGEQELAVFAIQGEHGDPTADAQYQQGGWAV